MKPHTPVRHKVKDFDGWKQGFDASADLRQSHGAAKGHLFRNADNADEVFILLHWDGMANAGAFSQSDEMREAMEESGVLERPDVYFLDEMEHFWSHKIEALIALERALHYNMETLRGVAQIGSALRSGRRGHRFKSGHPDYKNWPSQPGIETAFLFWLAG